MRGAGAPAAASSRDTAFVEPFALGGPGDVVLNSLTSPGMVAGSLALLGPGGRFVEIGKRDIWSSAAVARDRPDVGAPLAGGCAQLLCLLGAWPLLPWERWPRAHR